MNSAMIRRLAAKDWYFNRVQIAVYLVVGAIALAVIASGSESAFYVGSIILISSLIAVGVHLIMATVIYERKEQTLPFVMSLPVSPVEYAAAKILSNVGFFLLPWLTLLGATLAVIYGSDGLPRGLAPFAAIMLTEIFVAYCVMLAVALITESEGWTIFAVVICNLFLNFFLYWVSHLPAVADFMTGSEAVWNSAVGAILAVEAVAIVLLVGCTFWVQARKKDFL